jgi:hypothetical protein
LTVFTMPAADPYESTPYARFARAVLDATGYTALEETMAGMREPAGAVTAPGLVEAARQRETVRAAAEAARQCRGFGLEGLTPGAARRG